MKIAIIGSGIAGLVAAYRLYPEHDITVYEARDRLGGHTATARVQVDGVDYDIDTGFIVFNARTYPHFTALLDELNVRSRPSDMSFGLRCEQTGLEYAGGNGGAGLVNTLFAQRRRLLSPSFLGMLRDILRFNRLAIDAVEQQRLGGDETMAAWVDRQGLGHAFRDLYLAPMTSAIWSSPMARMYGFPVAFMLPFMYRHGLLNLRDRPRWYTVEGGSQHYVDAITRGFAERIRTSTPVLRLWRESDHVRVVSSRDEAHFDQVVLACHSDQALALLADADDSERCVLSAIRYQANDVVLHTDSSVLPANRRARASWNYRLTGETEDLPRVSYDMNRLMGIEAPPQFCVTLNDSERIDPARILRRACFAHPVFNREAAAAQTRWEDINGPRRTWFCGAWWGKGFHEDGVRSALRVVDAINERGSGAES